jgi:CheY-like chemotaxis protein
MPAKHVLSVGQCFADHSSLVHALERHFQAEVVSAATADEAMTALRERAFDLVLVNRVLDADGSAGLDIVEQIKADETLREVPVMLVSNYEEAQLQAVAKGALPGFGKAAMGQPNMIARLETIFASDKGRLKT